MGRKKVDRSNKVMQTFEMNIPLQQRLKDLAQEQQITVSELIRRILEQFLENRDII